MGIEKLRNSLLSEAKEEASKIVQTAEKEAEAMLQQEKAKQNARKQDAEKEVERSLEEQRNERIAWARLEAKRIRAEAREDAIKNVLEGFFDALAKARGSPEYKKFMKDSTTQAAKDLGGKVIIHVKKGEKKLVPKIKGAKIVEDLNALGGAVVESTDGKVRMDLTFESLVDSKRDDIRKQIAEKIFGEE